MLTQKCKSNILEANRLYRKEQALIKKTQKENELIKRKQDYDEFIKIYGVNYETNCIKTLDELHNLPNNATTRKQINNEMENLKVYRNEHMDICVHHLQSDFLDYPPGYECSICGLNAYTKYWYY